MSDMNFISFEAKASPDLPSLPLGSARVQAGACGYWVAVASADHVRRGQAEGFMQVCHGKAGPLRRIKPGDGVVYYSPTSHFRGSDRLQAFTAIGRTCDDDPYRFDMGGGFQPYRRTIAWAGCRRAPVHPLLDALDFTAGNPNWGYQLRFGLFAISGDDFRLIATAMQSDILPAFPSAA